MYDLFFGQNTALFTIPAVIGSVVFGLRMLLLLMGGDDSDGLTMDAGDAGDLGVDAFDGADGFDGADAFEVDGAHGAADAHDDGGTSSDHVFSIISVNTIAAFLMGAGWAGLGAYRGSGLEMGWSIAIAFAGGLFMVWFFGWLMKLVYDLQSSGNISIRQVVGREAEVDVVVPGALAGQGTVKVVIDDHMRRYRAITQGDTLARGSTVKVTKVNADNTVTVASA